MKGVSSDVRIGIDTRISRAWKTGVGRITVELLRQLIEQHPEHEYVVIRNRCAPELATSLGLKLEEHVIDCPVASPKQMVVFAVLLRHLKLDVLLHTHPLAAPLWSSCPAVGMVLDVYPILFPTDFPRPVSLYYRTIVPLAQRTKRVVIAISEASRRDAIRYLLLPAERVRVVPLAAAACFRVDSDRSRLQKRLEIRGVPERFILVHGNKRPHKNLPRLLDAYATLHREGVPVADLVMTGRNDPRGRADDTIELRERTVRLGIADRVHFVGEVSDNDLVDLYNGAEFVAMPSLYEGFGLPAIEAMACGVPVLAGSVGAIPEVVGTAGVLVDPYDRQAIADGCARLSTDDDLRQRLRMAGLDRAAHFSWRRTAEHVLRICEEVGA